MVVMFADLAGYTALTDVHGDVEAVAAVESFHQVVARVATDHGLHLVKGIGDAFLLTGEDSDSAMAAAWEIVEDMAVLDRAPAVRIGIHEGPTTVRGGDVFGHTVNIAARVASEAHAGQVLVTPQVLEQAKRPSRTEPFSVGTKTFRNVSTPIELFDICHDRSSDKFIDPICQMLVSPEAAAATLKHEGDTLYFCSVECLKRFVTTNGTGTNA
jgi:adenylate cyclase